MSLLTHNNVVGEDGRKRSESSLASLTTRQRGFVVGKFEGKSDRRAALDAGYAPSAAENTKQKIMSRPEVRAAFRDLLDEHVPAEKIVRCIVEGLDAVQEKFFQHEGQITETVTVPDHRVRLLFCALALKIAGWDVPPVEEDKPKEIIVRWQGEKPEWAKTDADNNE